MYTISVIPFLFPDGSYNNILTINNYPEGPLRAFVRRINVPRLSNRYLTRDYPTCVLGIVKPLCLGQELMIANDFPYLFEFLSNNGYNIDTQLTKMINKGPVQLTNAKILCFITYLSGK